MNGLLIDNKYLVIENLLNKEESDIIEKRMYDPFFPWYFTAERDENGNMCSVSAKIKKKHKNNKNIVDLGMFVHTFIFTENNVVVENSLNIDIAHKIFFNFVKRFDILNASIIRAKANLNTESRKYKKNTFSTPHIDFDKKHYVLIYYVNDCDGTTILFNDDKKIYKKISPKKGQGLIFKGNILHAGGHPVNTFTRCVINFNLQINDN